MRKLFADNLHKLMSEDKDVFFITGDLGYGLFDRIKEVFPLQFINAGAAEQAMIGVGIGLALSGKKVFIYSITPFLLYRPFEALRTYINHESIPVVLVGSGRDNDYSHDGFSHYAGDDHDFMKKLKNIGFYYDYSSLKDLLNEAPCYLNLKR